MDLRGTADPGCPAFLSVPFGFSAKTVVELRSTGQLRTAIPTWFVVDRGNSFSFLLGRLGQACGLRQPAYP
jgi:hypothetical protein